MKNRKITEKIKNQNQPNLLLKNIMKLINLSQVDQEEKKQRERGRK